MATKYLTLIEFIRETSEPAALAEYTEAVLEAANLSPEHKEVLRSRDKRRLDRALKDEADETFAIWAVAPIAEYLTLTEFISETSQPEALAEYRRDPEAAIERSNLSREHKEVLRSGDKLRLKAALEAEAGNTFSLWAIAPIDPDRPLEPRRR